MSLSHFPYERALTDNVFVYNCHSTQNGFATLSTKMFFLQKKNNFVNQRNATKIYSEARDVEAGDITELINNIWKVVIDSGCLEREVIIDGDNVAWSAEVPDISQNQIDKFVQIFDTKGRRNYSPSSISTELLVNLRNKEVHVIVFVYSRNVSTNASFNNVAIDQQLSRIHFTSRIRYKNQKPF